MLHSRRLSRLYRRLLHRYFPTERHMGSRAARALHVACITGHGPAARYIDGGGVCRDLRRRAQLGRVVGTRAVAAEGAGITTVREGQEKSRSRTGKGQRMRTHAGIIRRAGRDSGAPLAYGHGVEFRSRKANRHAEGPPRCIPRGTRPPPGAAPELWLP